MAQPIITAEVKGLDELERRLRNLPMKLAKKAMRSALLAGARVFKLEIARLAPKLTGFLLQHIVVRIKLSPKEEAGTASIGPVRRAFYGMFREFGTQHEAAKPFIRPAFESKKEEALEKFAERLREKLPESAQ